MFKRVLTEDWTHIVPFAAFFLFAAIFLLIAFCAIRLGREKRSRLANLPLDESSAPLPGSGDQKPS